MGRAAERLGASALAFRSAYWRYRHDYDAALSVREYWHRVVAASRPSGDGAMSEPNLRWLIEADVDSWIDYHDAVWTLAREFRRAGGRTARLSNLDYS